MIAPTAPVRSRRGGGGLRNSEFCQRSKGLLGYQSPLSSWNGLGIGGGGCKPMPVI